MNVWSPLRAHKWFSSASSTLLLHLRSQEAYLKRNPTHTPTPDFEREEASIYWSCYRAMWFVKFSQPINHRLTTPSSELRTELPLPSSILAEVDYPHVLPSPPSSFTASMGFETHTSDVLGPYNGHLSQLPDTDSISELRGESQEIWFFYMTDIILSRLGNRILRTLYDKDPGKWCPENLHQMLQAVNEFECKLEHWFVIP